MPAKKKVNVFIDNKIYTLVGEEPEEHVHKVAGLIDAKIQEIKNAESSQYLSTAQIAFLTSINMADDLLKAGEQSETLDKQCKAYQKEIDALQKEIKKSQQEKEKLSQELQSVKKELNEFIETFEESKSKKR